MGKCAASWMLLLVATVALALPEPQKQWVDLDSTYCGHLDCTKLATFQGEKFCSPCDNKHYCECKETKEPLPYLRKCPGNQPCQDVDRRGSCRPTMHENLCKHIDEPFRYL